MTTVHQGGRGEGDGLIEWAGAAMPVLAAVRERLQEGGHLRGVRVGVSLVLEPKTANLALALQASGAEVVVHGSGHSTKDAVAQALEERGLRVFAEPGATDARDEELARAFLATEPDILLDDGAGMIRLAHRELPSLVRVMLGAAEETTSGVRPLRAMHAAGALRIPVVAVNDVRLKRLFDNVYGTGQSCVMALLDITNLQLAGRVVVVVGYGYVGQGVARHAAALGARVVVSEIEPVAALQALHDGYRVQSLGDAAPEAEIVFAATGLAGAVSAAHMERMRDGVVVCTAGGGAFELPMDYLHSLGTARTVRPSVTEYQLRSRARALVIGEGECLNCSDAEGNPIEVMDLSLSLQALAAETLVTQLRGRPAGIYPLPAELEAFAAETRLRHEGASVEPVSEEVATAMRSW